MLGEGGLLSRAINGFSPRADQIRMARSFEQAIAEEATLVAEAGTGIGKTFAYLVPVLLAGKRAVISTGTKNLQEQLFRRDLPRLLDALSMSPTVAILKGRSNYVCLHRLQMARHSRQLKNPVLVSLVEDLQRWSGSSEDGELLHHAAVVQQPQLLPHVTSTSDNCLGSECDYYSDCFLVKARRRALDADLVVVNHHLLFADMALKEHGFGELIPEVDVVVVDEAHKVPETATQFFGQSFSTRQISDLVSDTLKEAAELSGGITLVQTATDGLTLASQQLRLAMDGGDARGSWSSICNRPDLQQTLERLAAALGELEQRLQGQAERSRGLESCWLRSRHQLEFLGQLDQQPDADTVIWYQLFRTSFVINITPLDISEQMQARHRLAPSWLFTSATLSIAADFSLYQNELGLAEAECEQFESPFDYQANSLMFLPTGLPEPSERNFIDAFIECVIPVIHAAGGRTFLLFTSHRNLSIVATVLAERVEYPLFVQGEAPRHQLLEDFQASGNGVLLGASSFWEGVDVEGVALSCVIIDKLPFAAPNDPLLEARLNQVRAAGRHPFMSYQVPKAALLLKQGAGRLIRSMQDRGVLVLTDSRITGRQYGQHFLAALPDMRTTRELSDVIDFFQSPSA